MSEIHTYNLACGANVWAKKWKPRLFTWPDLLAKLNSPARTGETVAEYKRMSKAEKGVAKDVGGFVAGELLNGKRSNRTVRSRTMVTLDADKAYPGQWDDATLICDYRMAMYSTHSHTPDAPRLRFIIPLDRPVSPDEYGAIARKLASEIGIETMDRTTYEPARLMYWPSCPSDGEYLFRHQDGPVVCADDVLASYGAEEAWRDTSLWPTSRDEAEVVSRELKELGDPREKPGLIGAFCRCYDVEDAIIQFIPEVYERCDTCSAEPRYTYAGGSTHGGVSIYNNGMYLFSRHDTDPAGGGVHCQNAFDVVCIHRFGHLDTQNASPDPTKRPSYKAMCEFVQGLPEIKKLLTAERLAKADAEFADLVDLADPADPAKNTLRDAGISENGEAGEPSETPEADDSWMEKLTFKPKTSEYEPTIGNALLILRHDPLLKNAFGMNLLHNREMIRNPLPWHPAVRDKEDGDPWEDGDTSNLYAYMEQVWKLKNTKDIDHAWRIVADENAFHPVQDYLNSLVWDGAERLDTLLIRYLKADDNEYVRAVTRKTFTAAAARMLVPGIKFDTVLVLAGDQGIGKSTLCNILFKGRFTDDVGKIGTKESKEALFGVWCAELGELASWKRSDNDSTKGYITAQFDYFRPSYGRFPKRFMRQNIFIGTTNELEFLKDRTGDRRYWPVEVKLKLKDLGTGGALAGLKDEVDQLWAEAVYRFRQGESLYMETAELRQLAKEAQAIHSVQDELAGLIEDFLDTRLPATWKELSPEDRQAFIQGRSPLDLGVCNLRRDLVSITEIRCELCGEDRARGGGNDLLSRRIAAILNVTPGWKKLPVKKKIKGYGAQWCFQRVADDGEPDMNAPAYVLEPVD